MRQGRIRMSTKFITDALQFPPDWQIESMFFNKNDLLNPYIDAVISGSDFPETTDVVGNEIKNCHITIHKENLRFEVKELT
ncbi:hypothetical protein KA005_51345 [bacterium]|nr:hypothetical protein [bacterium]